MVSNVLDDVIVVCMVWTDGDVGVSVTTDVDVDPSIVVCSVVTVVESALDVGVVEDDSPVLSATVWRLWLATATSSSLADTLWNAEKEISIVTAMVVSERMLGQFAQVVGIDAKFVVYGR